MWISKYFLGIIMKQNSIIHKMIENFNTKQSLKPRYKIGNLYVGEIVLVKSREMVSLTKWYTRYLPIKKIAIFYKKDDHSYIHIKSGQQLYCEDDFRYAPVGCYAIQGITPFKKHFSTEMNENEWTDKTKISKCVVEVFERETNKKLAPNQKITDEFGL